MQEWYYKLLAQEKLMSLRQSAREKTSAMPKIAPKRLPNGKLQCMDGMLRG